MHGDIRDAAAVHDVFARHDIECVVHFAAESHVDRSIDGPRAFIETNVIGTLNLLMAAQRALAEARPAAAASCTSRRDEVYGALSPQDPPFAETSRVRAEQPVRGVEGGVRPPGARLAPHLRAAGDHHQLLEQLRAVPVSGEADSAR